MNNKLLIGLIMVAGFLVGCAIGHALTPTLGGDFAGGVAPAQLWTGSSATNSVSPVLPNLLVSGAVSAGGVSAASQITAIYTATSVYPATAVTIGSSTFVTAATTTQLSFVSAGFAVGDACDVTYTGTTSTIVEHGMVSAVNGSAVTSTVVFLNSTGALLTLPVTSTVTGVSSTVKATCIHAGV